MTVSSVLPAPSAGGANAPDAVAEVLAKAGAENFPVAARFLSDDMRTRLLAIYGYARLVDDLGDLAAGDRLTLLDGAESSLDAALEGRAGDPLFAAVGEFARATGAGREQFVALIDANRQDQRVTRYATIAELEGYCALSANPVGRLVLFAFDADSSRARVLSDEICTALQVLEHLQDLGEDYAAGRVYLPVEDLERFGVHEHELGESVAPSALRRLVAFEVERCRRWLRAGPALVALLPGRAGLAIAGYAGGGLAQLTAIERAHFDTLSGTVKASGSLVAQHALSTFVKGRLR